MKNLEEFHVNVKIKLAALWTSVMFLYIYADWFALFQPGQVKSMLEGQMRPLGPVTQSMLVFTSAMMIIPSVMIFLSVALKATVNRWANVIIGTLYTVTIFVTASGSWAFMKIYGVFEVVLTGLVVWTAWTWPQPADR